MFAAVYAAEGSSFETLLGVARDFSPRIETCGSREVVVDLAGLTPKDVRVEAVVGRVGVTGELEDTECITLPAVEQRGAAYLFEREFRPSQTGRLGYALRVSPNHHDNPLTRPCNSLLKWGLG